MVEIKDKVNLTINEASELFGIGKHKIREIAKRNKELSLMVGNKCLIKRNKFERFLDNTLEI